VAVNSKRHDSMPVWEIAFFFAHFLLPLIARQSLKVHPKFSASVSCRVGGQMGGSDNRNHNELPPIGSWGLTFALLQSNIYGTMWRG
jgi:hypothetical protein